MVTKHCYQVQSSKLVTSYAVPPQTFFACRPCSVRRKGNSSRRYTYCAVERPEKQIKGFFEEASAAPGGAPAISSASISVKDCASPTVFVGVIPRASEEDDDNDEAFDVLSVSKDGRVQRFSPDLKTRRWSILHSEVKSLAPSGRHVSGAFLIELEEAQKALLKRRPDLVALAVGDASVSAAASPSILLLVSHGSNGKEIRVHIFAVDAQPGPEHVLSFHESQTLRHLNTVELPQVNGLEDISNFQWNFQAGSAALSLSCRHGFVSFDISQYSPTVASRLLLPEEDFSSVLRVSPHSVIGAGKSSVALYDTQYSSVQRSISAQDVARSLSSKELATRSGLDFVGYFAKLGIAVAIMASTLVAFDLSVLYMHQGTSLKRQRDGLLIDAIGRGVGSSSAVWQPSSQHRQQALGLTDQEAVERWNRFKDDLTAAVKAKDTGAFDKAVTTYFNLSDSNKSRKFVETEKILYVLSHIFTADEKEEPNSAFLEPQVSNLQIAIWPQTTCEWLLDNGHLTLDNIKIVLRRQAASKSSSTRPAPTTTVLRPGALVRAVVERDPTLQLLTRLLRGTPRTILKADELAHALKTYLDVARERSSPSSSFNGDNNANTPSTSPSLEDAFIGLNLTLTHLHRHPVSRIATALRSTLTNTQTLSLVHHLRMSLAAGGHTARFHEEPPVPLPALKAAPALPLPVIIDMLNASVDALGPSGWIAAAECAPEGEDIIAHMQAEVSAALAGVEEAVYMKSVLAEFIRYGEILESTQQQKKKPNDNDNNTESSPQTSAARITREYDPHGKLWETYTFPNPGDEDGKMLPLSSATRRVGGNVDITPDNNTAAPDTIISRTKVHKASGTTVQRSRREMAYLRRQAVPEYSVIRINL